MSKPIYQLYKKNGALALKSIENYYRSKFFSVFMNKIIYNENNLSAPAGTAIRP